MKKQLQVMLIAASSMFVVSGCQNTALLESAAQFASGAPTSAQSQEAVKQVLTMGVDQAINNFSQGSAEGGLKIPLPEQLKTAAAAARQLGFGAQVDMFENRINKAAEEALPAASGVFKNSIKQMTVTDAVSLLQGGDNAVTNYFRKTTSDELRGKFLPIVSKATADVGIVQQLKKFTPMLKTVALLAGVEKPSIPDVDQYITSQAMDAVYNEVSKEEKKIRENPAERSTELLKKVFSFYAQQPK